MAGERTMRQMVAERKTDIDKERWSGEGEFTQDLLDWLVTHPNITFLRVEDASSTRNDVDYNFISNEVFLGFRTCERIEWHRFWGFIPFRRAIAEPAMAIKHLEPVLAELSEFGPADYADEEMIQYLRTTRVIPPYQTKGYKLIELVRIYEVGTEPRA